MLIQSLNLSLKHNRVHIEQGTGYCYYKQDGLQQLTQHSKACREGEINDNSLI